MPAAGIGTSTPGIDRVFIGNFAVYQPSTSPGGSKLTINIRDESGAILGTVASKFTPVCPSTTTELQFDIPVCQPRTDGYYFGMTLIQGVRAYDPGSSQWTTPDAYAGDITDPMSQQKYMWNDNNPIAYSDPSGYCSIAMPASCLPDVLRALTEGAQGALGTVSEAAGGAATTIVLAALPESVGEGEIADEKSTRSADGKEIKDAGLDPHQVKSDIVGKENISKYDLRVDKRTGELVVFRKGANQGVRTGEFLRPKTAKPVPR